MPLFKIGEEALFINKEPLQMFSLMRVEEVQNPYYGKICTIEKLPGDNIPVKNVDGVPVYGVIFEDGVKVYVSECYLQKLPPPEDRMTSWPEKKSKPKPKEKIHVLAD